MLEKKKVSDTISQKINLPKEIKGKTKYESKVYVNK
jgi:hypothetical protein